LMRSTLRREGSFEVAARGKQQHQAEAGSPQPEAEEGDLFNPPVCGTVSEEFRRAARELCSPSPSIGSSEGSLLAVLASPASSRAGAGAGAGPRLTALQAAELWRTKSPQIKKQAALLAATIITPKPAAPSSSTSTSTSRPTSAPVVTV
jgi:hypothetical protein